MGHIVRINSRDQLVAAIRVLNELPGMWHSRGSDKVTELLLLDSHYQALLQAGVVVPNGKVGSAPGKKTLEEVVKP